MISGWHRVSEARYHLHIDRYDGPIARVHRSGKGRWIGFCRGRRWERVSMDDVMAECSQWASTWIRRFAA